MLKLFSKFIFLFVLLCLGFHSFSQKGLISDFQIIEKTRIDNLQHKKVIRPFIYSEKTSPLVKFNPVNLAFGGLLFLYQNTLSQQFSATCLYDPSCSEFSKQSIREYGLLKGVFLSTDRVMRCNRIAATGIHPLRIKNNKAADPVDFYQIRK
jgi:uncharacterized protein